MIKDLNFIKPSSQVPGGEKSSFEKISSQDKEVFKGLLNQEISKSQPLEVSKSQLSSSEILSSDGLKFSSHAIDRIQSRGISMKQEDLKRLTEAVEKATKKGAKETLVIMGDNAFIVSAKNKTVITALDKNLMKENVFTNIDSTVFA